MGRRWLGAILCALLVGISTSDAYAQATQKNFAFTLDLETSYFSLDLLDDFSDAGMPVPTTKWSAREKFSGKMLLLAKVRRIRFSPPPLLTLELIAYSQPPIRDVFRFQEVFRI
jgi:hypothetical protein